jgi:uncharacterized protein
MRIDAPLVQLPIPMDDWQRSVEELLPAADAAVANSGEQIAQLFLSSPTEPFTPVPVES